MTVTVTLTLWDKPYLFWVPRSHHRSATGKAIQMVKQWERSRS